MTVKIRLNEDGSLDEIVGKNEFAHLEQMDGDHWYLRIGNISVHLTSTKTIEAIFDESPMLLSPQVD